MSKTPKAAKVNWRKKYESTCAELVTQTQNFVGTALQADAAEWDLEICSYACELNKQAFDEAEGTINHLRTHLKNEEEALASSALYAKVEHDLLTEAKAEIERLKKRQIELYQEEFSQRRQNAKLIRELERAEQDIRTQRELLINYNTHGNLINWFGEFLLAARQS